MRFSELPNNQPWHQSTYGVLFADWTFGSQSLALLDNGELWASLPKYPTASGQTDLAAWVGVVSPEGSERKLGDLWTPTGSDFGLYVADTFGPHSTFYSGDDPSDMVTDGKTIYLIQKFSQEVGGLTGAKIWSLDPDTLALEWVAFDGVNLGSGESYADSHDAKLASSVTLRKPVWWNGAFYFWDQVLKGSSQNGNFLVTLRRWDPATGSVSTATPELNDPVGISSDPSDGWFSAENPATGFPNYFNVDVVSSVGDYIGAAIHNDWMYIVGRSESNILNSATPYASIWLRRIDMNNLSNGVETLYYGLALGPNRDHLSDYAITPDGAPASGLGTPQLYGFLVPFNSVATVVGDVIIFNNASTRQTSSRRGEQLCAFDIPALLQAVTDNGGPIRHNREEPTFYIVSSGSIHDYGNTDFNFKSQWAFWQHLDGGSPAFTHVSVASLTSNESAPGWGGKALFMSSLSENSLTWDQLSGGHIVKVLEPKGSTNRDFAVEFSFEGAILKSYGVAAGILPPEAPEEIILS